MNDKEIAQEILTYTGGRENVISAEVCMTRLRVKTADAALVQLDKLEQIQGVLGVSQQETTHIIFGPGKVNKVHSAFQQLLEKNHVTMEVARENKRKRKDRQNHGIQRFLQRVGNIFVALLPGIVAAGLINGICNVIN